MELIYHTGLNCHLAALINLAHRLGLPYTRAYSALWSETDFTYEPQHHIYTSKRVYEHLAALGLGREGLPCGPRAAATPLPPGTLLLVGMDAVNTPWHPVAGHFHSAHYFFAEVSHAGEALCSDPVYGQRDIPMALNTLIATAYELCRVYCAPAMPPPISPDREGERVLNSHPGLEAALLAELGALAGAGRAALRPLILRVTAMVNNRCLFARYLDSLTGGAHPFTPAFLAKWEGVKGGLYKATIVGDNGPVLEAVSALLAELLAAERHIAHQLGSIMEA